MRILTHRKTRGKRNRTRHEINAERQPLHVLKGDVVRVVRGDDKGKEGTVIHVYPKTGRVTIEGINIVKKHRKARRAEETSGIIEMPAPMDAASPARALPAAIGIMFIVSPTASAAISAAAQAAAVWPARTAMLCWIAWNLPMGRPN